MTPLAAAAHAAEVIAAVAGVALAFRRREHIPAAAALSLLAIEASARLVAPTNVATERALLLAAAAVPPGLAVSVFLPRRRRLPALAGVVVAWGIAAFAVAPAIPPPAFAAIQRVYLAADLAGIAVCIAAFLSWARWARGRRSPGSSHAVAILLVVLDLAILLLPLSPWHGSIFAAPFDVIQVLIVAVFAALTFGEMVLWRFSSD